ncbi:MAG: hypothetical protein NC416_12405 [Eubacterium sp.]|nr:hypothetical protein [Eubacterium sp.]
MMDIYESIKTNRTKIESVYDLAAICYDSLCVQIENQALFLAEYIEHSNEIKHNNPNTPMLKRFEYEVSTLFLLKDSQYSLDEIVDRILREIISLRQRLEKYGRKPYNEATIAYYLLQAVDLYTENKTPGSLDAPLNEKYRKRSYIYHVNSSGIITDSAAELRFRDKIQTTEIRHNFKCIRILEKAELDSGMNPPKLVTLHIEEDDQIRSAVARDKKLKIIVIPFGMEEIFTFQKKQGGSFYVEYIESHKQDAIRKALELLEQAIHQKANIIIFPEYVCFPELQERIGGYLRETYRRTPRKVQNLFLVVAGSGWTKDHNNVSQVYSYSGKLLGEQYKYSPYDGWDESGGRWIEGLRDPGKESVIVEIPGVGSVMTAICRDVSNRDLTEKMANIFEIDFLLAAAWSKSLHGGFENQLSSITEMNTTTCSLVCNCCAAAADQESCERGMIVTPHKKKSIIEAKIRIVKGKMEKCKNCTGCTFSIPLSFQSQDVEKGRIVGRITQNML